MFDLFLPNLVATEIPFSQLSGAAALAVIIIYIVLTIVFKYVKLGDKKGGSDGIGKTIEDLKKHLDDQQNDITAKGNEISKLKEQVAVIKANYESEERVKDGLEKRIAALEKAVISGNGSKSLSTRMALVERDIEDIKKKHEKK